MTLRALTIATSDSGGGGIQAELKAFAAAGGARAERAGAFGVAGEDAAVGANGPGSFHVALYEALAALDPSTLSDRAKVETA